MTNYKVIRPHFGDKQYNVGDTRSANPADVAHLLGRCLVEKKAGPTVKNKAAKAVRNKAAK